MSRTTQNCKLLIAYDFINNISFLIDTGLSYSLISTSKHERKINPDPTVLYSATSNIVQFWFQNFNCDKSVETKNFGFKISIAMNCDKSVENPFF